MLDNSAGAETKELLSYLYQLSKIFHQNHYFILEVKRRIMENISQMAGYQDGTLADAWLEKKVEFCLDHLAVQSKVSPGLSEYRAYLSSHTAYPLYLLTKVSPVSVVTLHYSECLPAEVCGQTDNAGGTAEEDGGGGRPPRHHHQGLGRVQAEE